MNADRVTPNITDLQAWRDHRMIDALIRNGWCWEKARLSAEIEEDASGIQTQYWPDLNAKMRKDHGFELYDEIVQLVMAKSPCRHREAERRFKVNNNFESFTERNFDRLAIAVAWVLPKRLVYWCAVRVASHAGTGPHQKQEVPTITALEALQRWDQAA